MQFEIHPEAKKAIDQLAIQLVGKITEHPDRPNEDPEFKSEKPIPVTLTDKDIIDTPIIGYSNQFDQWVARYSYRENRCIGLAGSAYQQLRVLADQFLKISWVRESLGQDFLEDNILIWCLDSFGKLEPGSLVAHILDISKGAVKNYVIWVPIALLEVEQEFEFGPVKIAPITKAMLDDVENPATSLNPEQADNIRMLFSDLRKRFQGSAAIVVGVEAASGHAQDRAIEIAETTIALLRIYSSAASTPWLLCACAISGSEVAPKTSAITFGPGGGFGFSEALAKPSPKHWKISQRRWEEMNEAGLRSLWRLIDEKQNNFSAKVRVCLLTFSKGLTFSEIGDRLVYTLSALEGLLLRDSSEPIQQNIGERMAFLIEKDVTKRQDVVRNLRMIYGLRSQYIHHRVSVTEEKELEVFWINAWKTLLTAADNLDRFESHQKFIEGIEKIKFGGA